MNPEPSTKANPLADKSFSFAVETVKLFQRVTATKKEYVLTKQLLKAGTSIGANVEEANGAISRVDFRNKISIAYKESRETLYWLRLMQATDYISENEFKELFSKCDELSRMLRASLNTINAQK